MPRVDTYTNEIVYAVVDRFIREQQNATAIADWLEKERGLKISREQVYPILKKAIDRGYIVMTPPTALDVGQRLSDRFSFTREHIEVIDVHKKDVVDELAVHAADRVFKLIHALRKKKGSDDESAISIGFASGRTGMSVAKHLALLMRDVSPEDLPNLTLHALSSGLSIEHPETSPSSFFSYFSDFECVKYLCLFAVPFVNSEDHLTELRKDPGLARCFKEAKGVDIVVTSLGTADDEHSDLRHYLDTTRKAARGSKKKPGALKFCGEVMSRPFRSDGEPITHAGKPRAVTCLELENLMNIAQADDRHVVLVSPPCSHCGKPKTDALYALMNRKRRLFSSLVLDVATAAALVEKKEAADETK